MGNTSPHLGISPHELTNFIKLILYVLGILIFEDQSLIEKVPCRGGKKNSPLNLPPTPSLYSCRFFLPIVYPVQGLSNLFEDTEVTEIFRFLMFLYSLSREEGTTFYIWQLYGGDKLNKLRVKFKSCYDRHT